MAYDCDGNRAWKKVTTGTNTVTIYYVVDDLNPTGYAQVVEELQPLPNQPTELAVVRAYTYGTQLLSQDQLINGQWTRSFYGYDGQSVRFLTDDQGNVTGTSDYNAFGNWFAATGSTLNTFPYGGSSERQWPIGSDDAPLSGQTSYWAGTPAKSPRSMAEEAPLEASGTVISAPNWAIRRLYSRLGVAGPEASGASMRWNKR